MRIGEITDWLHKNNYRYNIHKGSGCDFRGYGNITTDILFNDNRAKRIVKKQIKIEIPWNFSLYPSPSFVLRKETLPDLHRKRGYI